MPQPYHTKHENQFRVEPELKFWANKPEYRGFYWLGWSGSSPTVNDPSRPWTENNSFLIWRTRWFTVSIKITRL